MVACLIRDPDSPARPGVLEAVARACSPRVEPHGPDAVIFDVDGLARVWGEPGAIARDVVALAAMQAMAVRLALADTRTAAWILAHAKSGITLVPPGAARAMLRGIPAGWLSAVLELDRTADGEHRESRNQHAEPETRELSTLIAVFARWGLRTLGDIAALPRGDVHARMGPLGVRLHQAACGEDVTPLTPRDEPAPWVDRVELEWPLEGLEPLSFVLARQFDRLSAALEQADRGAVAVTVRLTLTTREVHVRDLHLPAPMRDARVLRTLVLLDLESHPPAAGIDVVEIVLDVTHGRIVQGSLLARSLPTPEDVATLVARLGALMGESRLGSPVLLDTYDERQVAMRPFRVRKALGAGPSALDRNPEPDTCPRPPVLRRFRLPIAARVTLDRGMPVRVVPSARGLAAGVVVGRAGPWRSSGAWWTLDAAGWDRDEWDLELADGAVYRLSRNRVSGSWDIEGLFD